MIIINIPKLTLRQDECCFLLDITIYDKNGNVIKTTNAEGKVGEIRQCPKLNDREVLYHLI